MPTTLNEPFVHVTFSNPRYKAERVAYPPRTGESPEDRAFSNETLAFTAGKFTARTPDQATAIRRAPGYGSNIFEDDMPEPLKCRHCGYTTKSSKAWERCVSSHGE
jgi:hypothetical protein